ncbi:MAG TPA: DUF3179 domain-containing (seleno)protein [Fimbriiglobus sp.]|nr:DUF3179 domain-containing (seleno)protein [Fimbriiglobus sp.]
MTRTAILAALLLAPVARADEPKLLVKPDAFETLINPNCSHCVDEAKRRASELRPDDPVLCWTRGYSDGGAIPVRFFLAPYRVISDSYGVFVYDPDAGFARGFEPGYTFRFHGWRNGVMAMKDTRDGTLYSCLTGVAFDGPKKGQRLKPVPTLTSTWGHWLERYPNAVAYHMFDKYKPVELPKTDNADSAKTRPAKTDPRLKPDELVLGVRVGDKTKAYPLARNIDVLEDSIDGTPVAIFRHGNGAEAAYRLVASPPRKFQAPRPDKDGVSPPDDGTPLPGATGAKPRTLSGFKDSKLGPLDRDTDSAWDVAGRAWHGDLKGWTLEPVDAVACKWFAWSAEYPDTEVWANGRRQPAGGAKKRDADDTVREVAGTAEFLRNLPKPFATLKAVDPKARTVTLLLDGEKVAKVWPVEPDAEIKVHGWWGRLEQFKPGQRVWAWLKLDRKKNPTSVAMLADEVSEFDLHASLKKGAKAKYSPDEVEAKRAEQRTWLRKRWVGEGLPGTLTFHHVFSGELEVMLDHEAMRWGRSLSTGDVVHLTADPPIKGVVKAVAPWRERTQVRLVVGELESAELKIGQRLGLKMTPPAESADASPYPPDIGRAKAKAERVEWFLASLYCVCPVGNDTCTGHFYTLASCNPNGCGAPNEAREMIGKLIDKGMTDEQIWDELRKARGPLMTKPHLKP